MVICGDTSFIFSLYGNDANSSRAVDWISACQQPVTLSPYNPYELGNALRLAEFRQVIKPGESAMYWSLFESAIQRGRLIRQVCNLADVLDEATRLSSSYTLTGGHRAFDVLHVAAARVMGAGEFLTFDGNQRKLAEAEGLVVPV